jgi:mono/diheme cytochrome c family protein
VIAAFLCLVPGEAQQKQFAPAAAKAVPAAAAPQPAPMTPQYALVKQYCIGCHNSKLKTAGVSLEGLDTTRVGNNAGIWEKVLTKVSAEQMPPAGLPRPNNETYHEFTSWLESALDKAAAAHPNPGRPTVHRLNRAEYSNSIRDLLAVDTAPLVTLPPDDTGYGFDNIGAVLSLSPVLIERYMSAANKIVKVAIGDPQMKPQQDEFDAPKGSHHETEAGIRAASGARKR